MQLRPFQPTDQAAVIALWHQCNLVRAVNDPEKDIRRKLTVSPELFLVGVDEGEVMATVMAGYEGHRGWVNYVAVAPAHQGKGWGRLLMAEAERLLAERGCPKVNLLVLCANRSAAAFYHRLGYRVDDVLCLGKRLERDDLGANGV